jgi:hypothetical protein
MEKIQLEGCEMSVKSIDFLTFHVSISQFKYQLWSSLHQKIGEEKLALNNLMSEKILSNKPQL